jgi:hypothetical protein
MAKLAMSKIIFCINWIVVVDRRAKNTKKRGLSDLYFDKKKEAK